MGTAFAVCRMIVGTIAPCELCGDCAAEVFPGTAAI